MRLEDEIKTRFQSPAHKLMVNIIYTHNWVTSYMQQYFKENGVTNQQYNILRILRGQFPKPSTIQLLRERMLDKQSDVSRLVDRLKSKGLLNRKPSKVDRRKMDIVISKKGLELLESMDETVNTLQEEGFTRLEKHELEELNNLLDKLRG